MDLTTRCPQCGTTFLASLEQLQLRKGYIRCVQCAHIFDGYEAVVPSGPASAGESAVARPSSPAAPVADTLIKKPGSRVSAGSDVPVSPKPGAPQHNAAVAPAPPSVVRGRREFTISDQHSASPSGSEPSWSLPLTGVHSLVSGADATPEHRIATPDDDPVIPASDHVKIDIDHVSIKPDPVTLDPEHFRAEPKAGAPARYTEHWDQPLDDPQSSMWRSLVSAVWVAVIAAGVLLFAAQVVYVFRVQIAENIPALRPGLERMCDALNCTVAYSRHLDMIVITQSSLQQETAESDGDGDGNESVLLQLTLRNVHGGPQEWPTLVLDLKDFSGALIARKHLPKTVYLPDAMADTPFPENSEHMIVLPLTIHGLKVNGYQLTAFFP